MGGFTREGAVGPAGPAGTPGVMAGIERVSIWAAALNNHNITIDCGNVALSGPAGSVQLASGVHTVINSAAVGLNGLDTGALATSTWYDVYLIGDGASATGGLICVSGANPTLPGGYTHSKRVGSVRTDATVNKYLLPSFQIGDAVRWFPIAASNMTAFPVIVTGVAAFPTLVGLSAHVPPKAKALNCAIYSGTAAANVYVAAGQNDTEAFWTAAASNGNGAVILDLMLATAQTCYWGSTGAANRIISHGWKEDI